MSDRNNRKTVLFNDAEMGLVAAAAAETHPTRSGGTNVNRAIREAAIDSAVKVMHNAVMSATDLDALLGALQQFKRTVEPVLEDGDYQHYYEGFISDLPTFGGEPVNEWEIWSWDDTRILVGTCIDDMTIEDRELHPAQYILIPQYTADGQELDPIMYSLDTAEETTEAAEALTEAGLDSAPVWVGEGEDAIKNGLVVLAEWPRGRDALLVFGPVLSE